MKVRVKGARRVAVSEVVGTLLSVAITLVAGAAVWGYVREQAGASAMAYANNVASTDNFLNEQFKIVDMNFPSSCPGTGATGCITFWIYNTGSVTFQPASVRFYDSAGLINIFFSVAACPTGSAVNCVIDLKSVLSTQCPVAATNYETNPISTFSLKQTNMQYITLSIPPSQGSSCSGTNGDPSYGVSMSSGTTYSVTLTGVYGNSVTYYMVHP